MKKLICILLTVALTLALCGAAMAEIKPVKLVIYSPGNENAVPTKDHRRVRSPGFRGL